MEVLNLWNKIPGMCEEIPTITAYIPENKTSDAAVVILPGGGYVKRCDHEGSGYAEYFYKQGICTFVCSYRLSPHRFPLQLIDSRRAMRFVRYNADKYGIDKNKVVIMGSSAGGHLAALTSTYFEDFDLEHTDDVGNEDYLPNAQILCYPVIKMSVNERIANVGTCKQLLGIEQLELSYKLTPQNIVSDKTPPCFMWHTITDELVPVENSLDYAKALKNHGISCEFHMFPEGVHGLGLADLSDDKISSHVSQWSDLMMKWLKYINIL